MLPIHNSLAEYVDFHQFKALVAAYNDNGGLVPPVSRWAASEVVELARLVGASHQSSSEQRYEVELLKYRVLAAQDARAPPAPTPVPASLPSSPASTSVALSTPAAPTPAIPAPPAASAPTPTSCSPVQSPVGSCDSFTSDLLAVATTAQLKASNAELASIKLEIETVRRQLAALRVQVTAGAVCDAARWNRERNAMFWATAGYDWLPVTSLQGAIPSNLPPITSLAAFNALDRPSLVAWAKYYAGAAHTHLIDRAALITERDGFLRRVVGIGIGVALGDPGAADGALVFVSGGY